MFHSDWRFTCFVSVLTPFGESFLSVDQHYLKFVSLFDMIPSAFPNWSFALSFIVIFSAVLRWLWCCCHTLKVSFLRPKKHGLILIYDPLPPEDSRNFLPVHHREDLSANSCMNSSVCTPFAANGLVCWDRGLLGAYNISQQIKACSKWASFSVCTLDSKNRCKSHLWSKLYTASIIKCFGQIYTVSHKSHQ